MNTRILALGLFVLAAAVAVVWFTWRPAAPAGGAESSAATTAPRPADPRSDLARPDGAVNPDARTARAADAVAPPSPAPSVEPTPAPSAPVDAGAPVSADQVTEETRVFADKYRELGPDARRAALLVLESVIAERVNSGNLDPEGKEGPSLADLKAELEWLRTHVEG